ncbi:MAG: divergent polysaccharide deacetylase family protein, partial [Candidatus Mariimomonas ferrooxydans]
NHMGSAFTKDERTMYAAISVLKEYGLFFLDNFTTPESAGMKLAAEEKVKTLKRDIFLDYKDSPDYIEARWEELIKLARGKGYAIAIAHPRKITVEFLKNALPSNEVTVVPLSELTISE